MIPCIFATIRYRIGIMPDSKYFVELAQKLQNALPSSVRNAGSDIHKIFIDILQSQFAKMQLVTREEFDAQSKVLQRAQEKLTLLEKQIAELEQRQ